MGENELTLMRLRKFSRIVMSKNERHRFEAKKLYRSNYIVEFLELHLTHSSDKVRYLALELFCCTIPRLANKTDSLLKPLLPKVFRCLEENEEKDMKLAVLHFLRCYFRHSKNLSDFVGNFIRLGIGSSDPVIQTSCCLGLNIVFDQDIGNSLFSKLIVPIINLLILDNQTILVRSAYRALRHVQHVIGDERFFCIINNAYPDAISMYKSLVTFEEYDSLLLTNINDFSTLVRQYQIKRGHLNQRKDFGILDPSLVDRLKDKMNCERAKAVCDLLTAVKLTPWTDDELDPHVLDFLKFINAFMRDSNRLIEMSGLKILKEVIRRMSFTLSPHIRLIVFMLREKLISPNYKIKSLANKVVYTLMRYLHPMTVMCELLHTKEQNLQEAALIIIQDKINYFPYHKLDMIALCNYLGQNLEHKNSNLKKWSKDCMILLLDIMRDCPTYGIKSEGIKVLLRNHNLSGATLRDIGILGNKEEEAYPDKFVSFSEEETTDMDTASIPVGSSTTRISTAMTSRSISTAGEFEIKCSDECKVSKVSKVRVTASEHFSNSCCGQNCFSKEIFSANASSRTYLDSCSQSTIQTPMDIQENTMASENKIVEFSDASSIKEQIITSETDSVPSFSRECNFEADKSIAFGDFSSVSPESSHTYKKHEDSDHDSLDFKTKHCDSKTDVHQDKNCIIQDERVVAENYKNIYAESFETPLKPQTKSKPRKHFTPFYIPSDVSCFAETEATPEDKQAGGDAPGIVEHLPQQLELKNEVHDRNITESYVKDGIQVDVLDKNHFNFNIFQVEECGMDENTNQKKKKKTFKTKITSNKIRQNILQKDKCNIPQTAGTLLESNANIRVPKNTNSANNYDSLSEFSINDCKSENGTRSQGNSECSIEEAFQTEDSQDETPYVIEFETNGLKTVQTVEVYEVEDSISEKFDSEVDIDSEIKLSAEQHPKKVGKHEVVESFVEDAVLHPDTLQKVDTPFKASKQLPRTPGERNKRPPLKFQSKLKKYKKSFSQNEIKETIENEDVSLSKAVTKKEGEKVLKKSPQKTLCRPSSEGKQGSPLKWGGCQWKRDLEYAAKAAACAWTDTFNKTVLSMKPYPSHDAAECAVKKAISDLYEKSWKYKEEAMLTVIRLAKHHPSLVQGNTAKIIVALSNEIGNFRQSVAGKAILTTSHLYEIMGKHFENRLRLVVAALLARSGNRTMAAYFRLVIKCIYKIINSISPQRAALAFIHEGSRHAHKAARETAAQFITILTERLGPENSLTPPLVTSMLRCASSFLTDGSALTRYCGKRMFQVFLNHPEFEKLKDQHLDVDTVTFLTSVLDQIKTKGITDEDLPINVIH